MNRRRFFNSFLLPLLPAFLIPAALAAKCKEGGMTVRLSCLDPRFVTQQQIAADSRGLTLEQWFVHAAVTMSGYHLNNGFAGDKGE